MKGLTAKQQEYLDYMVEFFYREDMLPPSTQLCIRFGTASPTNSFCHLQALEAKGYIEKNSIGKYKRGPRFPRGVE